MLASFFKISDFSFGFVKRDGIYTRFSKSNELIIKFINPGLT
jgi:hypothetical protein